MLRRALVLVAAIVMFVAMLPAPAQAGDEGWIVECAYSHSLRDDPIAFPAQPGASHLHDFFASRTTNAFSTVDSMRAGGTSCRELGDTAGYWTPALYEDGVRVLPQGRAPDTGRLVKEKFYYRRAGTQAVTPFPPGFAMILGNGHATTLAENPLLADGSHIFFGCADNNGPSSSPKSCSVGVMTLHFEFPTCWDGTYEPFVNEVPAMRYPSNGACPAGYVAVPRLIERFEWPVGKTTGAITFDSGPYFTAHADFVNAWNQTRFEDLVARCLNANVNCGTL